MAVDPMTEADIIDQVYSFYEGDSTTWSATSAEYLTARNYCKAGIIRWEYLEGIQWPELYTKLSSASDGTKTTTSGTTAYSCPTDMRIPPRAGQYVRIVSNSTSTEYKIVPLTKVEQLDDSDGYWCYFTGNAKLGFTLNLNPNLNYNTGDTIKYEYYRNATYFTAITSTTEMSNPFFLVHYCLHRFYKNDGLLAESKEELEVAENLLQEMKLDATNVDTSDEVAGNYGFGT